MSVEELIGLQRMLSLSRSSLERVVGSICVAGLLKKRLAALPDEALGQLMFDYVWPGMSAFGPETTICEVAAERLLNCSPVLVKTTKEINR